MEKFNPTNEMIEAARTVFVAMAFVETIKPVVVGYEKAILAKHQFHIAKQWTDKGIADEIILDPDHSYLLEDADFQVYFEECNKAREAAHLKVDNPEFCPLLVAEHLQSDAENYLIESMQEVTHIEPSSLYGDNRKKFLDLTLKLLVKFVKKEA
jgi:hypothetical protein